MKSNANFMFTRTHKGIEIESSDSPSVPHGLGVRISDFHSDGPGSIPGVGGLFDSGSSEETVHQKRKSSFLDNCRQ